jgi:Leucine-rich repeat (LRR) protein
MRWLLVCGCLLAGVFAAAAHAAEPFAVSASAAPDPQLVEAIRQAGGQINRVEAGHIVFMGFYKEQARPSSRFEFLKQLDRLQELNVSYTASAEWLESIGQLPELRTLTTYRGGITDQALGQLKTVTSLRHLELEVSPVTDEGLQALVRLTHLEVLLLRHLPVTDAGLETVARLPALKKLSLDSLKITPAGILALRDAPIEELTWWDEHRPRLAYLPFVKQMKHLKRLELSSLYVGDDAAEHLREMRSLEALNVYDHRLSDAGLRKLTELTNLRELNLSLGYEQYRRDYQDPFSERDLEQLTRLKELRALGLANTAVTDAGLRQVAKLTQLRQLGLGGTKVTAAGLATLGALPHLESLDITDTAAQAEPQIDLRMLKGLKTVNADGADERTILVPAGCAVITFD